MPFKHFFVLAVTPTAHNCLLPRRLHASPAPVVLGCPDVGRCMHRPYGAWNSGHLRSSFCYFDTLLPLASCRKLDPLRTPRADISVGPFSLGKAVLCLGLRPTSSNPRPSGARYARVHLRSCSDVGNLGQNIQPEAAKRTVTQPATLDTGDILMTINKLYTNESVLVHILAGARMYAPAPEGRGPGWPS